MQENNLKRTELMLIDILREYGRQIEHGNIELQVTYKNSGMVKVEIIDNRKRVLLESNL